MKVKLKGLEIKITKVLLKQILRGYKAILFKNPKIERLYKYRRKIMLEQCKCSDWYIKFKVFGKEFKFLEYCGRCGCYEKAKLRCETCTCAKGLW